MISAPVKKAGTSPHKSKAVTLQLILFAEETSHIVYCPALDLSGYGDNEMEAYQSFKTVLNEYLIFTTEKKTLATDLKKLGWKITKSNELIQPSITDLASANVDLQHILNEVPFRKMSETFQI